MCIYNAKIISAFFQLAVLFAHLLVFVFVHRTTTMSIQSIKRHVVACDMQNISLQKIKNSPNYEKKNETGSKINFKFTQNIAN